MRDYYIHIRHTNLPLIFDRDPKSSFWKPVILSELINFLTVTAYMSVVHE